MAIGDPFYDKTTLILQGDSFTDLSPRKNLVVPVGGAFISSGHGTDTPTGKSLTCGTAVNNNNNVNAIYINGNTLDDVGMGDFTIEIQAYITGYNAVFNTLLEWGMRDASVAAVNSFDVSFGPDSIGIDSINGTTVTQGFAGTPTNYMINTWRNFTIIKSAAGLKIYSGTTLLSAVGNSLATVSCSNTTNRMMAILASNTVQYYNFGGNSGYIGCLRITRAARPAPTSATFGLFPTYAAQITGNVVGISGTDSWTVTGRSQSGQTCSTTTFNGAYTLDCPTIEPYTVTAQLTVNGAWQAGAVIPIGYLVVPTNPDPNPVIYKCTSGGTTGTTEPAFTAPSLTDGGVTWVKQRLSVDPVSIGLKIPN